MKHPYLKANILFAVVMICMYWACTKGKLVAPQVIQQATSSDESSISVIINTSPSPGVYLITASTDDGHNETAEFKGYTFTFQADGDLIAKTDKKERVVGIWTLNGKETRMAIKISGEDALDAIDNDNWRVVSITDNEISLRTSDGDRVEFAKM